MNRFTVVAGIAAITVALASSAARAETVDEKIKKAEAAGTINITTKDKTHDACDKGCVVTITTTTDGNVEVRPGETKYFKIDKKDDYTRSGGFRWECGKDKDGKERSRIDGATYIKVVRTADTGAMTFFYVEIELK